MSTLVIQSAKTAGRALVSRARSYAISQARSAVHRALDTRVFEGPQLETFHVLTSRDGAHMARVYGRARLAGQVIWASRLKEHITEEKVGGKGGPLKRNYTYTISFAIGLCEGIINGVDRLWVNGQPLTAADITFRLYKGNEDQFPDPVISAVEGPQAPAFRGTAYMVFEDFPLDDYGARLPQINAEVLRALPSSTDEPQLEDYVTGVNLLPSSGEFAYAADIVEDVSGQPKPINLNNLSGRSDVDKALDQLETQLPNCKNVSIILSWFGTDLRARHCEIKPGIESRDRLTDGLEWRVCGDERGGAYLVSQTDDGQPSFGGTPSDNSVLQAIASLKTRGLKVSIYPFILMDIAPGNGLPDPYGGPEQAVFPWRGRITSTADMTAGAAVDMDIFFGSCQPGDFANIESEVQYSGPQEWSFRRFILHYARLAEMAGGVDRFIIGSEMRGLTTLRSGAGQYPAVAKLKSLAADVRQILGSQTGLTYAADWSEYFGHHDGTDVHFHLDPLWSDPHIDAVGIDAYFPLSDWRDGDHLDGEDYDAIYDLNYLRGNMEGGEGYEWYYASAADRDARTRTPITDGAYNTPWVYRYKDIRSWWSQPHYNRIDGVESASHTAWTPQSKPIWFTEIGCPAVDKGANQPNVFVDPKSSESQVPYHSTGSRDDLIQRRYIEAFLSYWQDNNPVSTLYPGNMVDMSGAHIWCWDARPFPDFPARKNIWADGINWQLGHWLTGRTGMVPLREIIRDIAKGCGAFEIDVSRVYGLVEGYVIDRPMAVRAALEPLAAVYDIKIIETAQGLKGVSGGLEDRADLTLDDIVFDEDGHVTQLSPSVDLTPLDARLYFINPDLDFQSSMVSARGDLAETVRVLDVAAPIVMGKAQARIFAEKFLKLAQSPQHTLRFKLSPARIDVQVGDIVTVPGVDGEWQIDSLERRGVFEINAQKTLPQTPWAISGYTPQNIAPVPWAARPELIVLDVPTLGVISGVDNVPATGPLVGAAVTPFNPVTVSGLDGPIILGQPAAFGVLTAPLKTGPIGRWDRRNILEMEIPDVDLASVTETDVLAGGNAFAVETEDGWEIIQAQVIKLVGPSLFRCEKLLRGLSGTDDDMMAEIQMGARIVYLGRGLKRLSLSNSLKDQNVDISGVGAGRESHPVSLEYSAKHLRPLSPVHPKLTFAEGGLSLNWTRRTRAGGDIWTGLDVPLGEDTEIYRVAFLQNEVVLGEVETSHQSISLDAPAYTSFQSADLISIRQGSIAYGFGAPLTVPLPQL